MQSEQKPHRPDEREPVPQPPGHHPDLLQKPMEAGKNEPAILDLLGGSAVAGTLLERPFSDGWDRTLIYRLEKERPGALALKTDKPDVLIIGGDFTDLEEFGYRYGKGTLTLVNTDKAVLEEARQRLTAVPSLSNGANMLERVKLVRADASTLDTTNFPDESKDFAFAQGLDLSAFTDSKGAETLMGIIGQEVRVLRVGGVLCHHVLTMNSRPFYQKYIEAGILEPIDRHCDILRKTGTLRK
jgi:hypothetical protein